jgi:cytochrome oxidase Cu insertion factor (SCO1/SenC/PrrC family)
MKLTALFAGLALGLTLAGSGVGTARPAANAEAGGLEALLWREAEAVRLVDAHGGALSPEALRDRLAVVSFVSADCTILCVTRTMDLDRLARDLPEPLRGRVVFLALGIDPADDARRLRAFAEGVLGPAPRLRFLPSDRAGAKALVEALRYPASALPEPPPRVLLFDRGGRIAMNYGGDPLDVPRLRRDLSALDAFPGGLDRPAAETSAATPAQPPISR